MSNSTAITPESNSYSRITMLIALLIFATFGLMVWGGVVRLTGSGLSIPEWPIINGSVLPPLNHTDWVTVYRTYHTRILRLEQIELPSEAQLGRFQQMFWVEYIHRTLAAFAGAMFLTLAWHVFRNRAARYRVGRMVTISGIAIVIQAIIGGLVVKSDIRPELLALHLGTAFFFIGSLVWLGLSLTTTQNRQTTRTSLSTTAWVAVGFIVMQVMSGALVAATHAGQLYNSWPLMNGYLLPPSEAMFGPDYGSTFTNLTHNPLTVQFIHRWMAFVAAGALLVTVFTGFRSHPLGRLKKILVAIPILLLIQISLGVMNIVYKVPFWFGLAHLAIAVPIFVLTLVIAHQAGTTNTSIREVI